MNARLTVIAQRRAALVAQAAAQRREVSACVQAWHKPLAYADRGMALARYVRAHPLALVTGVLLLFRLGRGRVSTWAGRVWTGWRIYQSLQNTRSPPRE